MNTSRLFRNFIFLFSVLGLGSAAWGDRIVILSSNAQLFSEYVEITADETAVIVLMRSVNSIGYNATDNQLSLCLFYTDSNETETVILQGIVKDGGGSSSSSVGYHSPMKIPGPCKLRIKNITNNSNYGDYYQALVRVESAPSVSNNSKYATVIPENLENNVSISLEQSTDLVNWTSASPGLFTPSTTKRFFRVRSQEQ